MNKIVNRWMLPILIIVSIVSVSVNAGDADCPICLEGGTLITLHSPSGVPHKYHEKCIKEWLVLKSTCPTCREPISIDSVIKTLTEDQKKRFWASVCVNATLSGITLWATDHSDMEWVSDIVAESAVKPAITNGLQWLAARMPFHRSFITPLTAQRIISYVAPQIAFWGTTYTILGKKGCRDKIDKVIFYSAIKGVRLISDFILRRGYDADLYEQKIDNDGWLLKKAIQAVPFGAGFFFLQEPAIEYIGIGKQHLLMHAKILSKNLSHQFGKS